MEIIKARKQPELLTALNSLDKRMRLPVKEKQHIMNMEKGYKGEVLFDSKVEEFVQADILILNDLLLTVSEQTIQIDSLAIASDTVYLYEIKNYKGNYQLKSGQLLTLTGQEIGNPSIQLKRTASLFRQSLKRWDTHIPVEATVVYVDPSFNLYHASPEDKIILPNQLSTHFAEINRQRDSLTKKHRYLAEKLLSEHRNEAPYQKQLPDYDYRHLKKGMTCSKCASFNMRFTQRMSYCEACGDRRSKEETIVLNVEEFRLLFPNVKMTRNIVHEWCGKTVPKERISHILSDNYKKKGRTIGTFYE